MKSARSMAVVLVTAPDLNSAREIAAVVLQNRLAACVTIVPTIESHYWWQDQLEHGTESLLVLKTTRRRLGALEKAVLKHHPYDTPEFLVLPLDRGSARYLTWLSASVTPPAKST